MSPLANVTFVVASFLEAIYKASTKLDKKSLADGVKVHACVYLGLPVDTEMGGHSLRVELNIEGLEDDEIIVTAHEVGSLRFRDNQFADLHAELHIQPRIAGCRCNH